MQGTAVGDRFQIGKHQTSLYDEDVIYMELSGPVAQEEGVAILEHQVRFSQGKERIFLLMNLTALESIDAEVRRQVAESMKEIPIWGTCCFNAPLKARVVAKLVMTAINLFSRGKHNNNPLAFVDTEAEAVAWINERRAALNRGEN